MGDIWKLFSTVHSISEDHLVHIPQIPSCLRQSTEGDVESVVAIVPLEEDEGRLGLVHAPTSNSVHQRRAGRHVALLQLNIVLHKRISKTKEKQADRLQNLLISFLSISSILKKNALDFQNN